MGTFVQSGGVNNLSTLPLLNLSLGCNNASSISSNSGFGTYIQSGGALSAYSEAVGDSGNGVFAQSGGTNIVGSAGYGGLNIGNVGYSGTYTLSGYATLTSAGSECVGNSGTGTFNQLGGTNTLTDFANNANLYLGSGTVGAGTYNLGAGALAANDEWIGVYGTGTFNQWGGTNTVLGGGTLEIGPNGTYNLTAGALLVSNIQPNGGAFNLGGGTLAATGGFATSQAVTLTGSGGNGFVNTGGYNVTLSGSLSGPGGLTKIGNGTLSLSNADNYTGPTTVLGGRLLLNFSQPGAPAANIVNNAANASTLVMGGGTLALQGYGTTNSQRFNGLTVNAGWSAIVLSGTTSNSLLLSLARSIVTLAGRSISRRRRAARPAPTALPPPPRTPMASSAATPPSAERIGPA